MAAGFFCWRSWPGLNLVLLAANLTGLIRPWWAFSFVVYLALMLFTSAGRVRPGTRPWLCRTPWPNSAPSLDSWRIFPTGPRPT